MTDAQTLELALTAANRRTHKILEGLSANDLRAACPNVVSVAPDGDHPAFHHPFSGPGRADLHPVPAVAPQQGGRRPILPPLGIDGDGKTYRVNSDDVAVAVAAQLKAVKLIFITSEQGLILSRAANSTDARSATSSTCCSGTAPASRPKCCRARSVPCRRVTPGVLRVHVIHGGLEEGLLAECRQPWARHAHSSRNQDQFDQAGEEEDAAAIQLLTRQAVESEELMRRTHATVEKNIDDYFMFEIDRATLSHASRCTCFLTSAPASWRAFLSAPRTRTRASAGSSRSSPRIAPVPWE